MWVGPKLLVLGTRSSSLIRFLASADTPSAEARCGPARYCCGIGTSQQVAPRISTSQNPNTPGLAVSAASPGLDPRLRRSQLQAAHGRGSRHVLVRFAVILLRPAMCAAPPEPVLHSLQPTKTTFAPPVKLHHRGSRRGWRTSYGIRVHFCWHGLYYEALQ